MALLPQNIFRNYMAISAGDKYSMKTENRWDRKCVRFCCYYCLSGSHETISEDIDAVMKQYVEERDKENQITIIETTETVRLKISNKGGTQMTDESDEEIQVPQPEKQSPLPQEVQKSLQQLPQIILGRISDSDSVTSIPWTSDDVSLTEAQSSPMLTPRSPKSATPSPIAPNSRRSMGSTSSQDWTTESSPLSKSNRGRHNLHSFSRALEVFKYVHDSLSISLVSIATSESNYNTVRVTGKVEFGLQYNYKTGAFEILVKRCQGLAAVDTKKNHSNPYVKAYLLPDKSRSGKRKTSVKKNTLSPVFDECLKFHIALNSLETRTLWLSVWHSDTFGRNDFLGEVMMPLENKVFDDATPTWYDLQEKKESMEAMPTFKGDILVGLKFVPPDMTVHKKGKRSRGALHILVKEAKCLTAVKANGTSDPFCKSYLLPDKGKSSKQKTSIIKKTVNPAWNHTFIYDDVTLQELAERCLELTIWDHDKLATNTFLGSVRFSLGTGKHYGKSVDWMDASGKEVSLWKSMLERPNFWVEGCLALRSTRDQRSPQ